MPSDNAAKSYISSVMARADGATKKAVIVETEFKHDGRRLFLIGTNHPRSEVCDFDALAAKGSP